MITVQVDEIDMTETPYGFIQHSVQAAGLGRWIHDQAGNDGRV
jgi:hypothetical protein